MMEPTSLMLQAVGGFVLGGLIGYAIRKVTKWILAAIGFLLLPIFGLWYVDVLNVNWEGVNEIVYKIVEWLGMNLSNASTFLASAGTFGVSTAVGFIFGMSGGFFRHSIHFEERRRFVRRK